MFREVLYRDLVRVPVSLICYTECLTSYYIISLSFNAKTKPQYSTKLVISARKFL